MPDERGPGIEDLSPLDRYRRRRTVLRAIGRGAALLIGIALAFQIVAVFMRARDAVWRVTCRANANQLSAALLMYAADYSERMPPADHWCDGLYAYTKNLEVFRCTARTALPGGFAFNRLLSTRPLAELNANTLSPAIFESSIGTLNASDELQSFITPHGKPGWIMYSTGWIQRVTDAPPATAGIRDPRPAKGK